MDIEVEQTNDGGDLVKTAKDFSVISGFQNMPLLALFGGNVLESTPIQRKANEQRFDYWGNSFMEDNPAIQFNSETERVLNNTALNSNGRSVIEQAVKKDLKFMTEFAQIGVSVTIPGIDRVIIAIMVLQPDNLEDRGFVFLWDATKRELDSSEFMPAGHIFSGEGIFDFTFDSSFE